MPVGLGLEFLEPVEHGFPILSTHVFEVTFVPDDGRWVDEQAGNIMDECCCRLPFFRLQPLGAGLVKRFPITLEQFSSQLRIIWTALGRGDIYHLLYKYDSFLAFFSKDVYPIKRV
jgi:hypothetical protein